ncbi:C39 family peptidase [Companilactobacillus nuruki]|uniref:Peptidase C39-like domain-containing protein n=1 Tax=Companilactobacillus nuruki TaxID=1993540 RepID=A0A2N7AUM1_9LACO|nr:C39 family peptidase [Companilactobacillus nuruki]PMD71171.1 hypothetical protein CBP76_06075 [Companilactobacillus nuruki]
MSFKRKLLYATLFASSCLISTTAVVKADTTADNADIISQSSAESNQQAQSSNAVEKNTGTDVDNAGKIDDSTNNVIQDNLQSTQVTQDASQATTQQEQSSHSDVSADGVYSVANITYLYDANGTQISNRALGPNTDWYTDQLHTLNDGFSYYHVATNEYARSSDGTYIPYVQSYSGNATVVYQKGSSIHDFQGYGNKATYLGNDLPTGSSWKVDNHANIGGKEWYEIGNNTWVPQDYVVINGGQYKDADWISGVPLIAQRPELPNGCEITAVTMMLQYAGANVNKMQLAYEMPRSSNPEYGYIGQPWDSTGITIFPNALMHLVERYAGSAKDLTGQGFDAIKYQINLGHPVVTWNTLYGFPYHALVVTGYDQNYVYYNDCWANQTLQMGINQFINNWNTQNRRAISY